MMKNIKHFSKSLLTGAAFALLLSSGQVMATDITSVLPTTPTVPGIGTIIPPTPPVVSCLSAGSMLDLKCIIESMMKTLTQTMSHLPSTPTLPTTPAV